LSGSIRLPDGTWIRGRGVRRAAPSGPDPTYGLYLGVEYAPAWAHDRVDWPDFWLPRDSAELVRLLQRALEHAQRGGGVEVGCAGGRGRTGTAIAALAIMTGISADRAVRWTREHYDRHAVETPWQRRWVSRFPALIAGSSDHRAGA
jgi:hypothetical protein